MSEEIISTKFYCIKSDPSGQVTELKTKEEALTAIDFLAVAEVIGIIPNTVKGVGTFRNSFSNYEFFFKHEDKILPTWNRNGWTLEYRRRRASGNGYSENGVEFSITDPMGRSILKTGDDKDVRKFYEIKSGPTYSIETFVLPVLRLFKQYSDARDLMTVELLNEIEQLKCEIQELKDQISNS